MKEQNMTFGTFIKKKRQADPRELTLKDVADKLGISLSLLSDIENNRRRAFEADKIEAFVAYLNLSEEEKALMFDLAGKDRGEVPSDIVDIMMYDRIGDMARLALRQSNAGNLTEADWKELIQKAEANKRGDDS